MSSIFKYLLLIFMLGSSNIIAQPSSFYKEYSTGSVELSLFALDTVHDGGYVLIGSYENVNGGNAIVIKTDSLGNELWRKRNEYFTQFDSTNAYYGVQETSDYGFILAGNIRIIDSTGSFRNHYLITKLDSVGNTIWKKVDEETVQQGFNSIIINSDSSFYTSRSGYDNVQVKSTLSKFDQFGDSIWSQS